MKIKKNIIIAIVISALVGYLVCSFLLFKEAFNINSGENPTQNPFLTYLTSVLAGLVGGIVAAAFGVKLEENQDVNSEQTESLRQIKLRSVGSYISNTRNVNQRELLGNIYAIAYFLVGFASIIFLIILDENATKTISNIGTTFIGMAIAIISAYFQD